jgi:NinB protein
MTRSKYQERKILLAGSMQVESAKQLISNAPIDPLKPIEVVIREFVKKRSADQNSYYFRRLGEISAQAWVGGKQFGTDAWHEYAKQNIMPDMVELKNGDIVSKLEELPNGKLVVISTTRLSIACFAEYINLIEAYGASELGVKFSANYHE